MMTHPRSHGRWLLGLALGCAWLLAGQHLAGQAGADQASHPEVATIAPPSTAAQEQPAAPPRVASPQRQPASPPASTRSSTRSSPATSPPQPHSTAPSTRASPPNSQAAARAVAFALTQQGKPYELGAEGPDAYDCSGLVWRAWQHAGLAWERMTAAAQWQWLHQRGHDVLAAQVGPGDLLFYAKDANDPASIHHVAMAIGYGRMVEAPQPGVPVRVRPLRFRGLYAAARPTP
jgi:cell wall-associated NlpC family hydrolase